MASMMAGLAIDADVKKRKQEENRKRNLRKQQKRRETKMMEQMANLGLGGTGAVSASQNHEEATNRRSMVLRATRRCRSSPASIWMWTIRSPHATRRCLSQSPSHRAPILQDYTKALHISQKGSRIESELHNSCAWPACIEKAGICDFDGSPSMRKIRRILMMEPWRCGRKMTGEPSQSSYCQRGSV